MLWDVTTGAALGQLMTEGQQQVRTVDFSPDGDTLASGSSELMFWDVSFEEMLAHAAFMAARNLTQVEWKQFLGNQPYRFTSLYAELLGAHRLCLGRPDSQSREGFQSACSAHNKDEKPHAEQLSRLDRVPRWFRKGHFASVQRGG